MVLKNEKIICESVCTIKYYNEVPDEMPHACECPSSGDGE